jgi:hypothetical protein
MVITGGVSGNKDVERTGGVLSTYAVFAGPVVKSSVLLGVAFMLGPRGVLV